MKGLLIKVFSDFKYIYKKKTVQTDIKCFKARATL